LELLLRSALSVIAPDKSSKIPMLHKLHKGTPMPSQYIDVSPREFLQNLFVGENVDRVHITHFGADPGLSASKWKGKRLAHAGASWPKDHNAYFCIGLLKDGSDRVLGGVESHHLIVADDVGTKVVGDKIPELRRIFGTPTFQIETSPGNETWGWRLAIPVSWGETDRLQTLYAIRRYMVREGLTDSGSADSVRYIRLPMGINSKEKYMRPDGTFPPVGLLRWEPEVSVHLNAVAEDIWGVGWRDVVAGNTDVRAQVASELAGPGQWAATMDNPWVQMADVLGMNPRLGSKVGVIDADCPNIAAHTVKGDTGFAFLGGIKGDECQCHHGNCAGLKTPDFVRMMTEKYDALGALCGPPDGVHATAAGFLAAAGFACDPVGGSGIGGAGGAVELAGEAEAMAERMLEGSRAEQDLFADLCDRFVYVSDVDAFWDRRRRAVMSMSQVNNDEQVLKIAEAGSRGKNTGSARLLNAGAALQRVAGFAYKPGTPTELVTVLGPNGAFEQCLNTYRPANVARRVGIPTAFFELAHFLVPDLEPREFFLDVMAFMLQKGNERTPLFMLLGGDQGIGKDVWLGMLSRVVGLHNCRQVSMDQFLSPYNDWLMSRMIYLPEFSIKGNAKAQDKLKAMTSAGPLSVTINVKYGRAYQVQVAPVFWSTTNDLGAIGLEPGDRRVFAYMSDAEPVRDARRGDPMVPGSDAWFARIATTGEGQDGELLDFLLARDISKFDPNAAPKWVRDKQDMALAAASAPEQYIADLFLPGGELEHRGVVVFAELEALARTADLQIVRNTMTQRAIQRGLEIVGWRSRGRKSFGRKGKASFWCRPGYPEPGAGGWKDAYDTEKAVHDAQSQNRALGVEATGKAGAQGDHTSTKH
jgi:hypothetical protein